MLRLACVLALVGAAACDIDEGEPSFPIQPMSGPPVLASQTMPDAGPDGGGPNIPGDGGVVDAGDNFPGADAGDFPQDAGIFLDAFDNPMMDAPPDPNGDNIP